MQTNREKYLDLALTLSSDAVMTCHCYRVPYFLKYNAHVQIPPEAGAVGGDAGGDAGGEARAGTGAGAGAGAGVAGAGAGAGEGAGAGVGPLEIALPNSCWSSDWLQACSTSKEVHFIFQAGDRILILLMHLGIGAVTNGCLYCLFLRTAVPWKLTSLILLKEFRSVVDV